MSQVANQCVYSQIQRYSLTRQRHRSFEEQVSVFALTRNFDIVLTIIAATAATAAGAHAANVSLTPSMLQAAGLGGAIKSGAMGFAGTFFLAPVNSLLIVLPMLLVTSIGTNVLLVEVVANRVLGHTPIQLLVAAAVASIPLSICLLYYYGGFRVPITITCIAFDVLGAYAFVRMAEHSGFTVCTPRVAMIAGAVFGTVSSVGTTLLSCCVIGRSRTISRYDSSGLARTHATADAGCFGNRVWVSSTTHEAIAEFGTRGHATHHTTTTVYNAFHGIGACWDAGAINGHCGYFFGNTADNTTTNTTSRTVTFG